MYSTRANLILGFHGCDEDVRNKIVTQQSIDLKHSEEKWDWLGHGIYFWENNDQRALEWAKEEHDRDPNKIKKPSAIGGIINLGYCLDLLDSANLQIVKEAHNSLILNNKNSGSPLPVNKNIKSDKNKDFVLRELDCAVIETLHSTMKRRFDSVRGMFIEGEPLYKGAGFRDKDHIQICILNPNCIKGYFVPRKTNGAYPSV
ncbi:MAG TPA: hypothetical protein VK783_00955 [Bacteroidia bacterium]|jgi:hypothetical protein|nr:hypothetical protein [Bacteroidia bacterium]